jgi:protein disulfide-isomerase-like protein
MNKSYVAIILVLLVVLVAYLIMRKGSNIINFSDSNVNKGSKEITDANYDSIVHKNKVVFVKVYTEWCGHCKNIASEWEALAEAIHSSHSHVAIASINAETESALAKKLGVHGYPTLLLIKNGKVMDKYNGQRNVSSMIAFIDGYA